MQRLSKCSLTVPVQREVEELGVTRTWMVLTRTHGHMNDGAHTSGIIVPRRARWRSWAITRLPRPHAGGVAAIFAAHIYVFFGLLF